MLEDSILVNKCYILRERIGEDTFSDWWRASAIFVASDFLLRFMKKEYAVNAELNQAFVASARERYGIVAPSILDIVEIDRHEGRLFLASEFSGHKSLRAVLEAGLRCSVEHACRLIIELSEGIDEFHHRGTAYGLVTPESVVVRRMGERIEEIKLLKPGCVFLLPLIPDERVEDIRENWGYAAPELKRAEPATTSSDIYSLGVLLFRLLAGKLPYGSRSGIRVKERSAAPAHVAAALARRGMPRELAAIAVRSLRKNPRLRYGDVMEFIADLRALLDSRRQERLRSGGADPIADLAMLNLRKANAGAREISRSLETVDYFRLLSQASAQEPDAELVRLEAPFDFEEEKAILELEDREAEGDEDDDSMSVEAILDIGYAAVKGKTIKSPPPAAVRKPSAPPTEPHISVQQESPFAHIDWNALTAPRPPSMKRTAREIEPAGTPPPTPEAAPRNASSFGTTMSSLAATARRDEAERTEDDFAAVGDEGIPENNGDVEWNRSGGSPEAVAAALPVFFKRATQGHGSVRFIENPGPGRPAALIANAVEGIRAGAFVVDLGALPPGIELGALLAILRTALALSVLDGGKRTRSILARRVASADPAGYLRAAPLGFILEGQNEEIPAFSEKDIDAAAEAAVKALLAFARKSRPLVLLARGTEGIGPSAHRFIMKAATASVKAPVCAFLFFSQGKAQSWHVLSSLRGPKG